MKMNWTRDFFKPVNALEIKAADCSAVAYLGTSKSGSGKVVAVGFSGKKNKPDFNFSFQDETRARKYIADHAERIRQSEAMRREWAEKRKLDTCRTALEVWEKAQKSGRINAADAAVCLRQVLAREFPGVKFSVRSDRCLNVAWTDGPSLAAVEKFAAQYSFEGFDGMVDCRYSISRWLAQDGSMSLAETPGHAGGGGSELIGSPHAPSAVLVNGGPDFVFCSRKISEKLKLELARKVCAKYGVAMPAEIPNLEAFLNNTRVEATEFPCGYIDLSNLVYRASTGALSV